MADNNSLKQRIRAEEIVAGVAASLDSTNPSLRHVLSQLEGTGVRIGFRNGTPDQRQKYIDMAVTVFMERSQI